MGTNIMHVMMIAVLVFSVLGPNRCCAIRPILEKNSNDSNRTATLYVDGAVKMQRKMPDNLFGVFFEDINHAGPGGLWAELVNNRGFEARNDSTTLILEPWGVIGEASDVKISTDLSSPFPQNKVALKMEILCDKCPDGGVGVFNPGYWGMNIEEGKNYQVTLYVKSRGFVDLDVALVARVLSDPLAHQHVQIESGGKWQKVQFKLTAMGSETHAMLTITTEKKGVLWLDQVSVMPEDTYLGHGFRKDIFKMIKDLNPGFIRFPGGNYVEGDQLNNSLDWKHTVGPWEYRPGHFNDAWGYWTDDGMGHLEYLQLAEDLGAIPIWVFSIGISIHGVEVDPKFLYPYIQDALDGLEFALGDVNTTWGGVRAAMGHPSPFNLKYVAPGNEDCGKPNYIANYRLFYDAIRRAYPNIKIITNCDGSNGGLDVPADLYEYHTYPTNPIDMYNQYTHFDNSPRKGPKAFVSEYAVWRDAAGKGNLLAALSESAFLMGLEKNSDVVEFASYAPLLVNANNYAWTPDAIVYDSSRIYGTPSYWMQTFFEASNGATYLNSRLEASSLETLTASAILWCKNNDVQYLRVKVVNYGSRTVDFCVAVDGLKWGNVASPRAKVTVMGSDDVHDENSFENPKNVVPKTYDMVVSSGEELRFKLNPHTLYSFDIPLTNL